MQKNTYKLQSTNPPSPNYREKEKKIPQLLQGRTDLMSEENFNRDPNKQTHTHAQKRREDQLKDTNLLYTSSKEKTGH